MQNYNSHLLTKIITTECAPHISSKICSDDNNLNLMKQWLGEKISNKEQLVKRAMDKTNCESESCLYTKIPSLDKSNMDNIFAPKGPWNNTAWLSNQDIDDVLSGYAKKFPTFLHIEYQMRDFAKYGTLNNLDWKDIIGKYKSVGCVVNTDLSSNGGQHWTAFYIDIPGQTVEYFDSAAQVPYPEFTEFSIKTAHILSQLTNKKFNDILATKIEHQKENTECGVYSLYYILSRLHGVPHKAFELKRVPDDMMVMFRKCLFRNS